MRRVFYIIVGIVLLGVAAAFLSSRLSEEPDLIGKYEEKITGQAPSSSAPRTRSAQPSTRSLNGSDTSNGQINILQMGLDIGNLLVGLIGIYLALFGGRSRRA